MWGSLKPVLDHGRGRGPRGAGVHGAGGGAHRGRGRGPRGPGAGPAAPGSSTYFEPYVTHTGGYSFAHMLSFAFPTHQRIKEGGKPMFLLMSCEYPVSRLNGKGVTSHYPSVLFGNLYDVCLQTKAWRVFICALFHCLYFRLCVAVGSVSFGLHRKKGD